MGHGNDLSEGSTPHPHPRLKTVLKILPQMCPLLSWPPTNNQISPTSARCRSEPSGLAGANRACRMPPEGLGQGAAGEGADKGVYSPNARMNTPARTLVLTRCWEKVVAQAQEVGAARLQVRLCKGQSERNNSTFLLTGKNLCAGGVIGGPRAGLAPAPVGGRPSPWHAPCSHQ